LNDSDQALLAWACRNLIELVVFVKYVLQSVRNAETFSKDGIVDLHQMIHVARNLQKQELPEQDGEADTVMEFANALKELAGISTDKYLLAGNLAGTVGKAAEYAAIHKICSKYVHPTAFSILDAYEEGIVSVVNWAFFQRGVVYNAEICKDIALYCVAAKPQAV